MLPLNYTIGAIGLQVPPVQKMRFSTAAYLVLMLHWRAAPLVLCKVSTTEIWIHTLDKVFLTGLTIWHL